jgi:hypothetical protein
LVVVIHLDHLTAELELRARIGRVDDRRVEHDARVSPEVARFQRARDHHEHQFAADDVRLDRTDPRRAVAPNRAGEDEADALEQLSDGAGNLRRCRFELRPAQHEGQTSSVSGPWKTAANGSLSPLPNPSEFGPS